MTRAAKHFKKRLDKFWGTDETAQYIQALDDFLTPTEKGELIQSKKGRYGHTIPHNS